MARFWLDFEVALRIDSAMLDTRGPRFGTPRDQWRDTIRSVFNGYSGATLVWEVRSGYLKINTMCREYDEKQRKELGLRPQKKSRVEPVIVLD